MTILLEHKPLPLEFMDEIESTVCYQYGMGKWRLQQPTRKTEVVKVRQLCQAMSKIYTKASLAAIGERFGGQDHATVIHAIKTVNNLRDTDLIYRGEYHELRRKIESRLRMIESGEHDTSLVCAQCGGKRVFTRIWLNANTGKIENEEFHNDCELDNWCKDCQQNVQIVQRCKLYLERKDLEREFKKEQEVKKYHERLQAIKDEFEN